MKVYIVSSFDNDEHTLELYPYDTLEKATKKVAELATELVDTLKLKHDDVKAEYHYTSAYIWNGEYYEYEIDIHEAEVE